MSICFFISFSSFFEFPRIGWHDNRPLESVVYISAEGCWICGLSTGGTETAFSYKFFPDEFGTTFDRDVSSSDTSSGTSSSQFTDNQSSSPTNFGENNECWMSEPLRAAVTKEKAKNLRTNIEGVIPKFFGFLKYILIAILSGLSWGLYFTGLTIDICNHYVKFIKQTITKEKND